MPGLYNPVDGGEDGTGVGCRERVDDLVEKLGMRVPEKCDRAFVRDGAFRARDELVEQRQRVSRGPAAGADDQGQHTGIDDHALALAERAHILEHRRRRDESERVVVRARPDRADDFLRLGRGEDELHVIGRLFDEFEQGVESLRRHHVRLVEDEDLEPITCGCEDGALPQIACVIDTVVAGGVDLDDIQGSPAAASELDAALARTAGGVGRSLGTVQAPREDARRGRLAAPARPGEQVGVPDAVAPQRGHERFGDLTLPDHLAERLGAIPAVQGGGHSSSLGRGHDIGSAACGS